MAGVIHSLTLRLLVKSLLLNMALFSDAVTWFLLDTGRCFRRAYCLRLKVTPYTLQIPKYSLRLTNRRKNIKSRRTWSVFKTILLAYRYIQRLVDDSFPGVVSPQVTFCIYNFSLRRAIF